MKQKSIPGYRAMFGEPFCSYERILYNMDSATALSLAVTLNNELAYEISYEQNQQRILDSICRGYTVEQRSILLSQIERLKHSGYNDDAYELFHRRYFICLLIKELKRNETKAVYIPRNGGEFSFLMAYLLVIDEEHAKDQPILAKSLLNKQKDLSAYDLIWTNFIRQYQFNESVSPLFEMFKLFALCKFALEQWRPFLKEYLTKFKFTTIGQLAHSYRVMFDVSQIVNHNEDLKKLAYLIPNVGVAHDHLQSLCINAVMGNKDVSLIDVKKRPLLLSLDGRYRLIDANFLYKHIFKGPFFDLNKTTGLQDVLNFPDYCVTVSKKVMEEVCFKAVLDALNANDPWVIIYDTGKPSSPDGYARKENIILLIEFKAYVLNDAFAATPDFEKFKKYIDENFIRKENGKAKGAGQIIKQLRLLSEGKLNEDMKTKLTRENKYIIYPVICHSDFHFSLPGINEYINTSFQEEAKMTNLDCFEIKNLTIINLDWLFDLSLRQGSFLALTNQLDTYWQTISERKDSFEKNFDEYIFLNSKSSFDEMYQHTFIKHLPNVAENMTKLTELLNSAGISQSILNEIV